MDSVIDSWEGSYTIRKTDPFEHIDEQRLMDSIGLPSFSSGNSDVTLTVPRRELSQAVLNARQATRQIINIKLMQLGIGGLAVGSTAAVINNSQSHDQDANVIINPFPGTLVGNELAAGAGNLAGFQMSNTPSAEIAMAMAKDRKRGSGSGYDRDAACEKKYSKKYDRQVKQRGIRGGLRGARSWVLLAEQPRNNPEQLYH